MFDKINVNKDLNIENMFDVVHHNLNTLCECSRSKTRFRVRRGMMNGCEVAVVVKATSFFDILISFLPSFESLRKCFSVETLKVIPISKAAREVCITMAKAKKSLPFISDCQWQRQYSLVDVYNPWERLPDGLTDKYHWEALHFADETNENQVLFNHSFTQPDTLSSFYHKKWRRWSIVDFPGAITNTKCIEIYFQAGKFHNHPSLRNVILKSKNPKVACDIANSTKAVALIDYDFKNNIDIKLTMKLLRTRAQQEPEFRKKLVETHDKVIFAISSTDANFGCVKGKEFQGGKTVFSYGRCYGINVFGRCLMQTREEIIGGYLPEASTNKVKKHKGLSEGLDGAGGVFSLANASVSKSRVELKPGLESKLTNKHKLRRGVSLGGSCFWDHDSQIFVKNQREKSLNI